MSISTTDITSEESHGKGSNVTLCLLSTAERKKLEYDTKQIAEFKASITASKKEPDIIAYLYDSIVGCNQFPGLETQKLSNATMNIPSLKVVGGECSPGTSSEIISWLIRVGANHDTIYNLLYSLNNVTIQQLPWMDNQVTAGLQKIYKEEYLDVPDESRGIKGLYICYKCKGDEMRMRRVQLRGLDEGMNVALQCVNPKCRAKMVVG